MVGNAQLNQLIDQRIRQVAPSGGGGTPNAADIVQDSTHRFVTDAEKTAWNAGGLTAGTTSQYLRGDKTWQTFDKAAIGLGNVPNTDCTNPANITQSLNYRFATDTEKSTWNSKQNALVADTDYVTPAAQTTALSGKVDKVSGKGLSTNDYTTAEQTKLSGIATGATANSTDTYLLNRSNHSGNQAATTITEDATHRWTTDTEKTTWNAKQNALVAGTDYLTPTGSGAGLTGLTKAQVGLNLVENTALSTWAGSANIATLGAVTTGLFNQTSTGYFYASGGARIHRFNDRIFLGGSTLNTGNLSSIENDAEQMRRYSTTISQLSVESSIGNIAIMGFSKSSLCTSAGSMGCIGAELMANNNNTSEIQYAWGAYIEARRQNGAGTTHGMEIDIAELGTSASVNPYDVDGPTANTNSNCLWLASGAGDVSGVQAASSALVILNNGSTFKKGIVFGSDALLISGNTADAISLATGHCISWYASTGAISGRFNCQITTATKRLDFTFSDYGWGITNASGSLDFFVNNDVSAANYITIWPAASGGVPFIQPAGSATGLDIYLKGKGVGILKLGYNKGNATTATNFRANYNLPIRLEDGTVYWLPLMASTW